MGLPKAWLQDALFSFDKAHVPPEGCGWPYAQYDALTLKESNPYDASLRSQCWHQLMQANKTQTVKRNT